MGESARKPGAPKLIFTVEELLTSRTDEGFTSLEKILPSVFATLAGVAIPSIRNWKLRRPIFAGIHQHFLMGLIGYIIGEWGARSRRAQKSEKDAILLHYISLHPEDFPPYEKRRYSELFLPWEPSR